VQQSVRQLRGKALVASARGPNRGAERCPSLSTSDYGQQEVKTESHLLNVYSSEKTLADLLRFGTRYGEGLFLKGLKPTTNLAQ
jgi:hypothetical protein